MRFFLAFSLLFAAPLHISGVYAANDWSKPCIGGVCHYDLDANNGPRSGTLKIWGPPAAISDITLAAGWHILGCDESATEQAIRLVCVSPSDPCTHLFSHKGAENKIVRLPEGCGGSPFARVKKSWVHDNQNLPDELATRLWKRDGQLPSVYGLELDIGFHEIDVTEVGTIRFAIQAATIPNTEIDIDTHLPFGKRSGRLVERSHEDIVERSIEAIRNSIKQHLQDIHIPNEVRTAATNAENHLENIPDKVREAATHVKDYAKKDMQKVKKPFEKHATIKFGPKHVDSNITLFRQTINCPPLYPGVEILLNPYGTIEGTIGLAASGTIIPPHIANFSTVTSFSADIDATLTLIADVMASFDSDRKVVFEVGLPGLDFPGIMSIKPKFQLLLQASLVLDIAVGANIPFGYHVKNAVIMFPAMNGKESYVETFGLRGNAPFQLKASPFVRGISEVYGHVIPTIHLDVSAFEKLVGINIMADSYVMTRFTLEADRKYRNVKVPNTKRGDLEFLKKTLNDGVVNARNIEDVALLHGIGSELSAISKRVYESTVAPTLNRRASSTHPALPVGPSPWAGGNGLLPNVDPSKGNAINGCIQVYFYIDITIGVDDPLFGILDENTRYSVYRNSYLLYQKCKGTSQPPPPPQKRSLEDPENLDDQSLASRGHTPRQVSSLVKRANFLKIKCLSTTIGAAVIFDSTKNINLSTTKPL